MTDPRLRTYYWIGMAIDRAVRSGNTDYQALERGDISITPLHMNLTHRSTLAKLKKRFS
jgi:5'-nucleotidase